MVNSAWEASLDLLFPQHCALCGLRSGRNIPLCPACQADLQPNASHCALCALPLPAVALALGRLCGNCQRKVPPFHRTLAPWLYTEHLAHLIKRWKFSRDTRLTKVLARLWLVGVKELAAPDLIIPVPLHWRRLIHRGFNQADLLARELRSQCPALRQVPVATRRVHRRRATAAQSGMDAGARTRNLSGAFTVNLACDKLRVAIVDDVLTTGATAAALATALNSAGASRVDVWCIARTPPPGY